jgi:hypothetical protein
MVQADLTVPQQALHRNQFVGHRPQPGSGRWPGQAPLAVPEKKSFHLNGRWLFAAREVGQAVITLAEDGNLAGPMRRSHPWGLPSGSGTLALLPR